MIFTLASRHLKLYFRDKTSVFFSLLSVFIIIGLYILFLGDLVATGQSGAYRTMMDQWIMAGVIAVSGFTTTLGAYGILVDDRSKKIERDFIVSPITPAVRILSYLLASLFIGVIMSIVTLVFAQIYIVIYGGAWFSLMQLLLTLGLIILNVMTSTSIIFFLIIFIKTLTAFSTVSTIVGTIIGFVMGIYVPIGNLPQAMQTIIKIFPSSHSAVLFRSVLMRESMDVVFYGAPLEERVALEDFLGVRYFLNGEVIPLYVHLLVLVVTMIVFYLASLLIFRLKKHKS